MTESTFKDINTKSRLSEGSKNFIGGTVGGISQVISGHPFDTIKVRLQTQNGAYKSAMDCFWQTVRKEGTSGLYKGVSSPLLGAGVCTAVLFSANGIFKNAISGDQNVRLSIYEHSLAGALSGIVMTFVTCPTELIKIRLQVQDSRKPKIFNGFLDCLVKTTQIEGVRGLFRGIGITMAREVPSFAGYFGTYEGMKYFLRDENDHLNAFKYILAGGVAGFGAWIPCFPQDVIKSRIQASADKNMTIKGTIKSIYRSGGVRGFFSGFGPVLARAFPANAATFVAYELAKSSLDKI